jgi:DNA repair protein RecN (Recombination protein N)
MLKKLYIKDYALIEELEVEFNNGLNIITGETGAGKSIIIDSLNLVLGERANSDVIRRDAPKAVVEAHFDVIENIKVIALLEKLEIEFWETMIIRREINSKGQNRCFINDTPCTLVILKEVGDFLMDLHGQHEHQSLLRAETHIDLLDDFGSLQGMLEEYQKIYKNLSELFNKLDELKQNEKSLKEKRELLDFQIKEIDELDPQTNELEQLESELAILENYEELYEITNKLYEKLYEKENSVHDELVICKNQLEKLSRIDKAFLEVKEEAKNAEVIVSEITKYIQNYNSRIEFDPEKLENIRNRIGALTLLKKKYGGTIESVIEHRKKIGKEFSLAENFENEIININKQIGEYRKVISDIASRLSSKRREVAKKLEKSISKVLKDLGIEKSVLEVKFETKSYPEEFERCYIQLKNSYYTSTAKGMDKVEFFISLNEGEEVKPLAKVASGGEISRIMLSLKTILAKSDRLPVLAFDEIDVGVSGRIAKKVGLCLKNLSNFHQILCITHLPQIAGLADSHYVVEKKVEKHNVTTNVRMLTLDERITEIAKLLSGESISETALNGAKELIGLPLK